MTSKFIDTYEALQQFKPLTKRDKARHFALNVASRLLRDIQDWEQLFKIPRIQFIYLHHVFTDEERNLDLLLKYLSNAHTFISYSDAVDRICNGKIDKPYIVFSSDDGLKNNLRASEILSRYDAKACFFICPEVIGESNFNKIENFCNDKLHFPAVEFLSWDEVEILQSKGHEIGGHTMSHVKLSSVSSEIGSNEIINCHQVISKYCGSQLHFAFPYGRYFHFPANLKSVVYETGYKTCASAERGCHITTGELLKSEDLLIRRDHIILTWPLQHVLYFLAQNIKNASFKNNFYPF